MRKLILLPVLFTGMIIFSFSCKKGSHDMVTDTDGETINVKIAPNQAYQMDLTGAGTISILRQAIHFSVSETIVNSENGTQAYKYVPAKDFTGNDQVELLSNKTEGSSSANNSGGCTGSGNSNTTPIGTKFTTIKILVAN